MTMPRRALAGAIAAALALAAGTAAHGQTPWLRDQNVQPVFEGWERNPDGSFNMVFGYLNRNYEEQPVIPVGANNFLEPGEADRGQPTHFYPRRQQFVFKVRVPADWGRQGPRLDRDAQRPHRQGVRVAVARMGDQPRRLPPEPGRRLGGRATWTIIRRPSAWRGPGRAR